MAELTPKQESALKRMWQFSKIVRIVFLVALLLSLVFVLLFGITQLQVMQVLEYVMFGIVLLAAIALFLNAYSIKRYCEKIGFLPDEGVKKD